MSEIPWSNAMSAEPEQYLAALFLHFKRPVMIVEGRMQYLYDEKGQRFLDVSHSTRA